MSKLFRKLFHNKENDLHVRLRKAVKNGQVRQVADLLDAGASPIWNEHAIKQSPHNISVKNMNALLLACQQGDIQIVDLILNACQRRNKPSKHYWGYAMYCVSIRFDQWQVFMRLEQRGYKFDFSVQNDNLDRAKDGNEPLPIFLAAQLGQLHFLKHLLAQQSLDWPNYHFCGHTLLSVASLNGHYECVGYLLTTTEDIPSKAMNLAVHCAQIRRQAHVLVLLTSCLPQYGGSMSGASFKSIPECRNSLAETEVLSNGDWDEERPSLFSWQGSDEELDDESDWEADNLYKAAPKSALKKPSDRRNVYPKQQRVRFEGGSNNPIRSEGIQSSTTRYESGNVDSQGPQSAGPTSSKKRKYVRSQRVLQTPSSQSSRNQRFYRMEHPIFQ
uniref:Uncharacterized protein AlNc14C139G7180 n=1 Tax=Albugo laibachii Nc14 TaxID=890382 RepID=F0WKZ0_9STRA|nr:conserved hypothetical protein [Albugo laibachii Nc14]|eukprot:CCA21949.1 conserved hypothetical protein [Albugo laibachii Nc14]